MTNWTAFFENYCKLAATGARERAISIRAREIVEVSHPYPVGPTPHGFYDLGAGIERARLRSDCDRRRRIARADLRALGYGQAEADDAYTAAKAEILGLTKKAAAA